MKILFPRITSISIPPILSFLNQGIAVDVVNFKSTILGDESFILDKISEFKELVNVIDYVDDRSSLKNRNKKYFKFLDELIQKNKYDYVYPHWPESQGRVFLKLNEIHNLPGPNSRFLKYLSKQRYYSVFKKIGVPFPEIFKITKSLDNDNVDYKFPLIVKPEFGSGAVGTKIIYSRDELINFFSLGHQQVSPSQEKVDNKLRHWEYSSINGNYIIQKFIPGRLVTITGRRVSDEVFFDAVIDMEATEPPYCAEVGQYFPSLISDIARNKIFDYARKFLNHINLKQSPFLFDVIVDQEDNVFFIDFGMRIPTNPQRIIHCLDSTYSFNWIRGLLKNTSYEVNLTGAVAYRKWNFEKGIVKQISSPNINLANDYEFPKEGAKLLLSRNDIFLDQKGSFTVVADNISNARRIEEKILKTTLIEYIDQNV
jgi:hypothetical protein